MEAITSFISAHPSMFVVGMIVIVVLILNFIFKSLIKLVLIMLFIGLAAFGYYYTQDPKGMPDIVRNSIQTMETGFHELKNKGKNFFTDSEDLYKKTKDAPKNINKLLDFSDKDSKK